MCKRPRVDVYSKAKREQNALQRELQSELLQLQESAVCVNCKLDAGCLVEKDKTAVEKLIAKLDLGPGEYSVEVDASGDVHIRLGLNVSSCATTLIVRDGQVVCAYCDEVEEPDDPFARFMERLMKGPATSEYRRY